MLAGADGYGIDPNVIRRFAEEIFAVQQQGVELAVVGGGGNIFSWPSRTSQDGTSACGLHGYDGHGD